MGDLALKGRIGALMGLLALLFALFAPLDSMSEATQRALGLALFAVFFWTTEPIPIELSSLLLLLLLPFSGLLSFEQSFAPFSGKTLWLIFAGMVLSLSIAETGLGDRLAGRALGHLGESPLALMARLHLLGLLSAFLVPSGAIRVLLLMPLGISLIERMQGRQNPRLNAAVLLSLLCSTYFGGGGVLTGSVPNLVVAGQLERYSGEVVFWADWLVWMFPVIGLLRTGLSLGVLWLFFGRHLQARDLQQTPVQGDDLRLARDQRRVLLFLLAGVALWAADFLHHVAPAYVGLGLALLLVFPGPGPLPFASLRKVNFPFLFYIAALFSLGAALQESGFNTAFVDRVRPLVDIGGQGRLGQHLAITFLVVPLNFLMDIAAVAAVITPSMIDLGRAHGLQPLPAALSAAMATNLVFLPYQAAPFMIAYGYRRFSMVQLVLSICAISLLSLLLLCPLNVLYWLALGLV